MNRNPVSAAVRRASRVALSLVGLMALLVATAGATEIDWQYRSFDPRTESSPPPPDGLAALVLDDGTAEGAVGIGGSTAGTARQFLWLNSFVVPAMPFDVREVRVLFLPDPIIPVGGEVQLALWLDPDGDPASGAELLATFDVTVQSVDGSTFSVYPLDPPVRVAAPGRLLVGVVDRFVTSNVTPSGVVAAIDVSASAGQSWLGIYSGDPPDPPSLPADQLFTQIDDFQPGNWMIRAYGEQVLNPGIPELGGWRLGLLIVLIAGTGMVLSLRRGR